MAVIFHEKINKAEYAIHDPITPLSDKLDEQENRLASLAATQVKNKNEVDALRAKLIELECESKLKDKKIQLLNLKVNSIMFVIRLLAGLSILILVQIFLIVIGIV